MRTDIDELLDELWEVNEKAVTASDQYNLEVARITRRETARARKRGETEDIMIETIVRGVIDKSPKLSQLVNKQKFFSSEVLRVSALLQGLAAHRQLVDSGYRRNANRT